jgi:hypothetical protein
LFSAHGSFFRQEIAENIELVLHCGSKEVPMRFFTQ